MNFLGAMGGIGAGITAGTKDWRMADEAKKDEAYRQAQLGIMQSQDARAQAADTRSQATHDIQMGQAKQSVADENFMRTTLKNGMENVQKILAGDNTAIDSMAGKYNQNGGAFNDGNTVEFTSSLANGGRGGVLIGADGTKTQFQMTRQQLADKYMQGVLMQMEHANPTLFMASIKAAKDARAKQAELDKPEYISLGDGMMGDKRTGKTTGTPTVKPVSVPAGSVLALAQPDGSYKQVVVNPKTYAPAGHGALGGDASKGAKFDKDADGNRVILYRDGTQVYPKDSDGNPVKIKVGTDEDQKFVRQLVISGEKHRYPREDEDSVVRAQELAQKTKSNGAQAVKKLTFDPVSGKFK